MSESLGNREKGPSALGVRAVVMRSPIEETERRRLLGGRESLAGVPHIILHLKITPAEGLSVEEAAVRLLVVATLRTMRRLNYEQHEQRISSAGMVTRIDVLGEVGNVEIALPLEYCSETEGITHLLMLMTALSEYNYTKTIWIENIEIPKPFADRYKGPRFGIQGIRRKFGVSQRPLVGMVLKPRVGVSRETIGEYAEKALMGGADFLVDDLLMVDPAGGMRFDSRVPYFADIAHRVASRTGEAKLYFVNISSSPNKAFTLAEKAMNNGAAGVLVNGFTMGFGTINDLAEEFGGKLILIATNMGVGIMTRGSWLSSSSIILPTGISEAIVSKISRLAGADAIHTGTSASECYSEDAWGPASRSLSQRLFHIKPSMAVAEGDLNIANLWENIRSLGTDLLIEATSGIINYPGGPKAGATALRLLAEELKPEMGEQLARSKIEEMLKNHKEIKIGLKFFGYSP